MSRPTRLRPGVRRRSDSAAWQNSKFPFIWNGNGETIRRGMSEAEESERPASFGGHASRGKERRPRVVATIISRGTLGTPACIARPHWRGLIANLGFGSARCVGIWNHRYAASRDRRTQNRPSGRVGFTPTESRAGDRTPRNLVNCEWGARSSPDLVVSVTTRSPHRRDGGARDRRDVARTFDLLGLGRLGALFERGDMSGRPRGTSFSRPTRQEYGSAARSRPAIIDAASTSTTSAAGHRRPPRSVDSRHHRSVSGPDALYLRQPQVATRYVPVMEGARRPSTEPAKAS